MISFNFRGDNKPRVTKGAVFVDIYRGKFNLFPNTLFGAGWHTTAVLRLPGFFFIVEFSCELRFFGVSCVSGLFFSNFMGGAS